MHAVPTNSRRRWALPVVALLCLCGMWAGCDEKKHYKVLSFFFDGVPDPSAPTTRPGGEGGPTRGTGQFVVAAQFQHKPYAENKCDSCHGSKMGGDVVALNTENCFACHKDVGRKYTNMHGPVVAGACLWCHAPHESSIPALLKAPSSEVCSQCHEREVLPPTPPAHLQRERDCLDCHVGHGSAKRMLLRPTTQAASLPAEGRAR